MIIHFVRHGHPNYKDDCLTEIGRKQAELAGGMRTFLLHIKDISITNVYGN